MRDRTRRAALGAIGATSTTLLAGCLGGNGNEDLGDQELDPDDWEDVESIELDGYTRNWIGVSPDHIEDITNPTLLLFEGREYEISWTNRDGSPHNIAIRDEDQSVVDDYRTSNKRDRDESQTLEFEATTEMHEYVCQPHPHSMIGYLQVEDA